MENRSKNLRGPMIFAQGERRLQPRGVLEQGRDPTSYLLGDVALVSIVRIMTERVISLVVETWPVETATSRGHVVAPSRNDTNVILPDDRADLPRQVP
jgi:hypothetical protein